MAELLNHAITVGDVLAVAGIGTGFGMLLIGVAILAVNQGWVR